MSKIKQYAEELYGENWSDIIEDCLAQRYLDRIGVK